LCVGDFVWLGLSSWSFILHLFWSLN